MPGGFIPNPDLERAITESAEYQEGVREKSEEIAAEAEQMARAAGAPFMPREGVSALIEVEQRDGETFIVNREHGGHLYEYGAVHTPVAAPLRRAAMAQGLEVDETPE